MGDIPCILFQKSSSATKHFDALLSLRTGRDTPPSCAAAFDAAYGRCISDVLYLSGFQLLLDLAVNVDRVLVGRDRLVDVSADKLARRAVVQCLGARWVHVLYTHHSRDDAETEPVTCQISSTASFYYHR